MAKDISTIAPPSTDDDSIDINKVTNSNTDSDREDITPETPPADDTTGDDKNTDDKNTGNDEDAPEGEANELKNILTSFNSDELDEENTALKAELLTKYGGSSFNENGDIIDEDGNVVTTVDDILKSLGEAETTNADGDLVDADGKVLKTKAELAAENSVVNKLHSELEYEFLDEDGKAKVYSDDAKGMAELSNDMATHKLEQFKANFFGQNPELTEVAKHLLSGGTLKSFQEPVDYSKIAVKDLDKAQKLSYIKESLKAGGMTDTRVASMLKRIEDSNGVDDEAEEALADLTFRDKESKKVRDAEYKESIRVKNEETAQYWDEVEQTITKGDLTNVNVPEKDKAAFFDYVSNPVNENGASKEMLDSSKETMEQKLAFAYIRFKGYKLNDLINSKAKSNNVMTLQERLRRSAKQKPTPTNDANGITSGKGKDVSINDLLP